MDYAMLRKLRNDLNQKRSRTTDEEKLLLELQSLEKLLDNVDFSLLLSSTICKACGRPLLE